MFSLYSTDLSPEEQVELGLFIEKHLSTFLSVIPPKLQTKPIDIIFEFLQGKIPFCDNSGFFSLESQVHLFDKFTGCWLYSNPPEFNQNLRQLFFLVRFSNYETKDVEVVLNLDSFFRNFGVLCFFCKKQFKGKGSQHKCPKAVSCFTCRRPFLTFNTSTVISKYFCDSSLNASIAKTCETCNLRIFSDNCRKHHSSKVCRFGWLCNLCQKYTYKSKFLPNILAIKEKHVCGTVFCNFCGVQHSKDKEKGLHLCPILRPRAKTIAQSTNLGFLSLEVVEKRQLFCKSCFQKKKCDFCYDGQPFVNICTVYEESKVKGSFDEYCFSGFGISTLKEAVFSFENHEENVKCSAKKTFFNQIQKRTTLKGKFEALLCPLGQFFNHILQLNLKNFTYIVYDNFCNTLEEILKFVLKQGIRPKIVCMPHLALIDIFELQIRFINLKNYIGEEYSNIVLKETLKETFFPLTWNQPRLYNYIGPPPSLDDFFCFDDSEDIIARKKIFVQSLKSPWNFKVGLKNFSKFKASLTCRLGLLFLEQSFKTQNLLKLFMNDKNQENIFVCPFDPPIFTRAAYAYQTLLTFCPELSDVRMIREPIKMSSSKSELEYCAFLRYKYPKQTFQDAWSPLGQKKFRETHPDSFSSTLQRAFFFNGCLIHGHKISECLFKRKAQKTTNYFNVPFAEALEKFETKNKKLLKNHEEVKKIEVQWECLWKLQRKTDPILQNFIANVFQDPPNYRLNVQASGNVVNLFIVAYI